MGCLDCKKKFFVLTVPENCVIYHSWGAIPCGVKTSLGDGCPWLDSFGSW